MGLSSPQLVDQTTCQGQSGGSNMLEVAAEEHRKALDILYVSQRPVKLPL